MEFLIFLGRSLQSDYIINPDGVCRAEPTSDDAKLPDKMYNCVFSVCCLSWVKIKGSQKVKAKFNHPSGGMKSLTWPNSLSFVNLIIVWHNQNVYPKIPHPGDKASLDRCG